MNQSEMSNKLICLFSHVNTFSFRESGYKNTMLKALVVDNDILTFNRIKTFICRVDVSVCLESHTAHTTFV